MKISARGWRRDHGAKDVAFAFLSDAIRDDEGVSRYSGVDTYVRLLPPRVGAEVSKLPRNDRDTIEPRVRISVGSEIDLNLNGRYLIQCDLTKSDIADLFQLTHAEDSLDDIVQTFAKLRAKRAEQHTFLMQRRERRTR